MSVATGSVLGCWRYPVKSLQGLHVEHFEVGRAGVDGDRTWVFVDTAGKIASAKRYSALLMAAADDRSLTPPDDGAELFDIPAPEGTFLDLWPRWNSKP